MIEYLAAGAVGAVIGGFLVWNAKDADKGASVTEAVLAEQARSDARAQVAFKRGKEQGAADERAESRKAIQDLRQKADDLQTALDAERQVHDTDVNRLKEFQAAEIKTLSENFAQQLKAAKAAAYQEGKESDGMYRGNDGTGRMVSAKKAKSATAIVDKPSTPVKAATKKAPVKRAVQNGKTAR